MKKIYVFALSFLFLFFFHSSLFAQCSTVNVEAYPLSEQSGAYNYFGVRVTLAQVFNQDVTVTGYIHKDVDEWNNQDHPFTLTVPAGSLTAETEATFYQTDPTAGAAVTVSSVNPCPFWNSDPSNPSNPYDYAGQDHNNALDYALGNLNLPLSSGEDIVNIIQGYFSTLNSTYTMDIFMDSTKNLAREFYNTQNITDVFTEKGYSSAFASYYNSMETLLDNALSPDEFYTSMISLEAQISSSSLNSNEKQALLIAASVFRFSVSYWSSSEKTSAWETKLSPTVASNFAHMNLRGGPNSDMVMPTYFFFSWKNLGKADGKGAIEGAVAGAIGGAWIAGPPGGLVGAVAGGVAWGAGCSVSNVIGQLTGWW